MSGTFKLATVLRSTQNLIKYTPMEIVIDHREKCQIIAEFIEAQPNINVTYQNMPVGDYLLQEKV